ncbi:hypothetical protein A1F94_001405 [Pyrenophora tritici-repentis]|nr:hypothetical protein A1F94_001405 [Pyrenophora tritici-repentis]
MEKLPKKQGQTKHAANTESLPVQTDMRNSALSFNSSNTSDMPKRAETQKDPEQAISTGTWELVEGSTDPPHTNTVSLQTLVIKLRNISTAELKTLIFSNMEHAQIDWTSRAHIVMIS